MKRRFDGNRVPRRVFAACVILAAVTIGAGAAMKPVTSHGAKKGGGKLETVTLAIRHRVFHQFSDLQKVRLNEDFVVGDTDYTGRVIRYVPDFSMDLDTGKIVSRSEEPRNPAFQILVREKGVPQDTAWALLNMPPHFSQKSMLAFKVARIDFIGHEPILADTTRAPAMPGMPPHGDGMTGAGHPGGFQMPPAMPPGMSPHPPIVPRPTTKTADKPAEKQVK